MCTVRIPEFEIGEGQGGEMHVAQPYDVKYETRGTKIALFGLRTGIAAPRGIGPQQGPIHMSSGGGGGRPRALPSPEGPRWRWGRGRTGWRDGFSRGRREFIVSYVRFVLSLLLYNNIACAVCLRQGERWCSNVLYAILCALH